MQFKEIIDKTKKICDYYEDECENCPINNYCDHLLTLNPNEIEDFENLVSKWQPNIYPTLLELIHYMFPDKKNMQLHEIVRLRIPEKIAKEFGIIPINEGGLNKYTDFGSEWR